MRAILADAVVVDAFGPESIIDKIEFINVDVYRVPAGRCRVDVVIADKKPASDILRSSPARD
jgi:hypothetical protein